jgi:hypothetical protein
VFLQGDLLHVLSHPQRVLRHTAGSITTTIVGALGLSGWPELVVWLGAGLQAVSRGDSSTAGIAAALDGALDSLSKVVEDHPHEVRPQPALRERGRECDIGCVCVCVCVLAVVAGDGCGSSAAGVTGVLLP